MANTSPQKTPRGENGRSKYVGYNANPENVGTRTGKAMPQNVRRDENGFEDPEAFIGDSSPSHSLNSDVNGESSRTATTRIVGASSRFSSIRNSPTGRLEYAEVEQSNRSVFTAASAGPSRRRFLPELEGREDLDEFNEIGLPSKRQNRTLGEDGQNDTNRSFEDMDISTLTTTPVPTNKSSRHRPRPSASPSSIRSRPILSQISRQEIDAPELSSRDESRSPQPAETGYGSALEESPSARAAKSAKPSRRNPVRKSLRDTDPQLDNVMPARSKDKSTRMNGRSMRLGDTGLDLRLNEGIADAELAVEGVLDDIESITGSDGGDDDEPALAEEFEADDAGLEQEQEQEGDEEDASSKRQGKRPNVAKLKRKADLEIAPKKASKNTKTDVQSKAGRPTRKALAALKGKAEITNGTNPPLRQPAKQKGKLLKRKPPSDHGSDSDREVARKVRRGTSVIQEVREEVDEDARTRGRLRSAAERHAPLRYWMGEKPVLTRNVIDGDQDAVNVVPELTGWITKTQPEPVQKRPARAKRQATSQASTKISSGIVIHFDPEAEEPTEVLRRIACTKKMVKVKDIENATFTYQKIFGEDEFFAAGVLNIQVNGEKAPKNSRDNVYVFYVAQGSVEVTIHRTQFVMAQGGQFLVPRGNSYGFRNVSNVEVQMFFSQARRLKIGEGEGEDGEIQSPTNELEGASLPV